MVLTPIAPDAPDAPDVPETPDTHDAHGAMDTGTGTDTAASIAPRPEPLAHPTTPTTRARTAAEAQSLVATWETQGGIEASFPVVAIGDRVAEWLPALERRMPREASAPVGTPSVVTSGR